MQWCKSYDTYVIKRDKFNLNQCPKHDYKAKEIQKMFYPPNIYSFMSIEVCRRPNFAYIIRILDRYLRNLGVDHYKIT